MGTAGHLLFAAKGRAIAPIDKAKLDRLTDEELDEVRSWHRPTPLEVLGFSLSYEDAIVEAEVGLDEDSAFSVDPAKAITIGHTDMYWQVRIPDPVDPERMLSIVVVADIKKTRWTTLDGPESLQLHAYGYALCQMLNAEAYVTAIWLATEGEWVLTEDDGTTRLNSMFGMEAVRTWATIKAAALHQSDEYTEGPHCTDCWERLSCPKHMVRYGDTCTVPGTLDEELTEESAAKLILEMKRWEDTAAAAKKYLKEWVRRNGPISDGNGKQWGPVKTKGRECSLGPKQLRERMGAAAEMYIYVSPPHDQYRWTKVK